jgi:GDPmannose 4,6-dehydratase
MNKKLAIITGSGQDATHLSKLLLEKDYDVVIATRRSGSSTHWRLRDSGVFYHPNFRLEYCDITEFVKVMTLIQKYKPDEFYHLGAMSFVQSSFDHPITTMNINTIGYLNILEAIRNYSPDTKIYFAGSSEMFGKVQETPQSEKTPFYPRSPYGVSKLSSYWLGKNYRESYGMFVANGILFNHEGIYRGAEFVTRKITKAIAKMKIAVLNRKEFEPLIVGNIQSQRDWGSAKDYVIGMWLMLQQDKPDDFVLATTETHTIKEFIDEAWGYAFYSNLIWKGEGMSCYAVDDKGNVVVKISEEFFRPCEVELLLGDYSKAYNILGWRPTTDFSLLVREMMLADLEREEKNIIC